MAPRIATCVIALTLSAALPARGEEDLPIEAFLIPEELELTLPPIARPSDGSLTLAVGPFVSEGLDEARDALVQARVDQMGSALGQARVVRLKPGKDVSPSGLCKAGAFVDADFVLWGSISVKGERGTLKLSAADVTSCRQQTVERAILRRQESTLIATIDGALCSLVKVDERPKVCNGSVKITGETEGVEARLGAKRSVLTTAAPPIVSFVGTYPLVLCRGTDCSQPTLVDVQLGQSPEINVSLACGRPQVVAPGAIAQCDTVVVETVVERPFRWGPVGTGVLGVALVATGIVFGVQANAARDDLHAAYDGASLTQTEASRLQAAMQTSASRANLSYGLGVIALAAGATTFVLDF